MKNTKKKKKVNVKPNILFTKDEILMLDNMIDRLKARRKRLIDSLPVGEGIEA